MGPPLVGGGNVGVPALAGALFFRFNRAVADPHRDQLRGRADALDRADDRVVPTLDREQAAVVGLHGDRAVTRPGFVVRTGGKGELHLNGGTENDSDAERKAEDYYAHEFAHVVDIDDRRSGSEEWTDA